MRVFKPSIKSNTTLKKKKTYTFGDIPDEIMSKAHDYSYEEPLFFKGKFSDYLLYEYEGTLFVKMFLSFQTFREVFDAK